MIARALALATFLCAGPALAGEAEMAIKAFVEVCPAALFAPETLDRVLRANGLSLSATLPMGAITSLNYANTDERVSVSVITHEFSDARHSSCVVGVLEAMDTPTLNAIRAELEASPLVGTLEGQLLSLTAGIASGYFKRPGNDPLMTVWVNGTSGATVLSMEMWEPEK